MQFGMHASSVWVNDWWYFSSHEPAAEAFEEFDSNLTYRTEFSSGQRIAGWRHGSKSKKSSGNLADLVTRVDRTRGAAGPRTVTLAPETKSMKCSNASRSYSLPVPGGHC